MCAFSGKSLWVLDYGASPDWDWDWVDHIKPASKGGDASLENGVCASSFHNARKGDNSRDNEFFYHSGNPQPALIWFHGRVPDEHLIHLDRFSKIHFSDWYLNRAIAYLLLGIGWLKRRDEGQIKKRDLDYYSKAAFKKLNQWRRLVERHSVESIDRRGMSNDAKDSQILCSITRARSPAEISHIGRELLDCYKTNHKALKGLVDYFQSKERNYDYGLINNGLTSQRVKDDILRSLK